MKNNIPRKHHTTPQFYLGQWTGEDGKLTAYRVNGKSVNEPYRASTKEVCVERDIYANKAMNLTTKEAQDTEMTFFNRLDSEAATAHKCLIEGRELTPDLKVKWIRFLMSMIHRNPENMQSLERIAHSHWENVITGNSDHLSVKLNDVVKAHEQSFKNNSEVDAEKLKLKVLEMVSDSSNVGPVLYEFKYSIEIFTENVGTLLTSDNPVIRINGLAEKNAFIAVPISPRSIYFAAANDETILKLKNQQASLLRRQINDHIVHYAKRWIIAKDYSQTRFIFNRLGRNLTN